MDIRSVSPTFEQSDNSVGVGIEEVFPLQHLGLGGEKPYKLRFLRTEFKNGEDIQIDMYEIEGDTNMDVAKITIRANGTPVQHFTSDRIFMDIPLSGKAKFFDQDPDGNINCVKYNGDEDKNVFVFYGQGHTDKWEVEPGDTFEFLELCTPRFIDAVDGVPLGEEGIIEFNNPEWKAVISEILNEL